MKTLLFLSLIMFTACSPREDEPTPQPISTEIPAEFKHNWTVTHIGVVGDDFDITNSKGYFLKIDPDNTVHIKNSQEERHEIGEYLQGNTIRLNKSYTLALRFLPADNYSLNHRKVIMDYYPKWGNYEYYFIVKKS